MPSLDETAAQIIHLTNTRGADAARLAVQEADAYLGTFGPAEVTERRVELVDLLRAKGRQTSAMDHVILAVEHSSPPAR